MHTDAPRDDEETTGPPGWVGICLQELDRASTKRFFKPTAFALAKRIIRYSDIEVFPLPEIDNVAISGAVILKWRTQQGNLTAMIEPQYGKARPFITWIYRHGEENLEHVVGDPIRQIDRGRWAMRMLLPEVNDVTRDQMERLTFVGAKS